ncbi:PhzF family phenazine biosynthesis protein [Oceanospirillum beijerinckii]|uniref:PhzF family phenazine biosynthesis protein n=1 Tax=Oceanospirillum beijerinckii TaxID=64976 RepID=UPI00041A2929|nr:PhzF family phenazine biosynthesis protein [Oceanospirillum beijerinckii]
MTTDTLTAATVASQNNAHTAANNTQGNLRRLSAFTQTPEGGNPAGVWIGEQLPPAQEMQAIAAEVGFSETAFIAPSSLSDLSRQ